MSQASEEPKQEITVRRTQYGFTVQVGERYHPALTWDEMLGTVAQLTHPKIGESRYPLMTREEWQVNYAARGINEPGWIEP